ncbi:hypothetical protein IOK49_03075 [Fervidicoccus fontis]|uniref:Uncharacterized protein n=2 Tax=Fervidicoccus fontis TaxID=683846 RepID=I0A0E0_FERFK|nr:hypothetical protein [Fervidicoccus fontis]AFH42447.1 hypothetical protein FFONT_0457 [Fervidicoccus fontis Kam940]MBE9391061.1 hypothetical protein [Fervidicoccus fontis]
MEILSKIPLTLGVLIPKRNTPFLAYLTDSYLEISYKIKQSSEFSIEIRGLDERIAKASMEHVSYLIKKGSPLPLKVDIEARGIGNCSNLPSAVALILKGVILSLEEYYEEKFSNDEKIEILNGVMNSVGIFPEEILQSLIRATVREKSLIYSDTDGEIFLEDLKVRCNGIKEKGSISVEKEIDSGLLDMYSKLNSYLLILNVNGIVEKNKEKFEQSIRGLNSLYYAIYDVLPEKENLIVPSYKNELLSVEIKNAEE